MQGKVYISNTIGSRSQTGRQRNWSAILCIILVSSVRSPTQPSKYNKTFNSPCQNNKKKYYKYENKSIIYYIHPSTSTRAEINSLTWKRKFINFYYMK